MQHETPNTLQLTLTRGEGIGRVIVPLEDFLGFDLWVTQGLEELVDRWSDLAAPRSTRTNDHSENRNLMR